MILRRAFLANPRSLTTAAIAAAVWCGDLAGAEEALASNPWKATAAHLQQPPRQLRQGARSPRGRAPPVRPSSEPGRRILQHAPLVPHCHSANGDVDGVRKLFSAMPVRDVASWNTMVSGLPKSGDVEEAKAVFLAQVCGDCYNAAKVISKIEIGEIILRNTTHFHHFRGGHSSSVIIGEECR
ncbi:hypothetical protein ABZP36_028271 [Zizania latifolia]